MARKRNALDAIMPDLSDGGKDSVINTESLPHNSERQHPRRRRPLKEKAVKQTYSLYPRIIRGVERYADGHGYTYSQVVTMALVNLIPKDYFDDGED